MSMMLRRAKVRAAKAVPTFSYEKPVEPEKPKTVSVEDMSYDEVKSLAQQNGIKVYGKKAADLKEEVAEKLGL